MDVSKRFEIEQVEDVPSAEKRDVVNVGIGDVQLELSRMGWRDILAIVALIAQMLNYETSLLIPSTILSYVNEDLGPDPSYTWIAVSWSLCAAIIVSVAGRLSDIFGRRYFMLSGGILSLTGAVVGATGQSITQMIVSGVLFGIASGIQETFYAAMMELVPYKRRMSTIGMACVANLPSLLSPLIAYGIIARTSLGWRACYWYICGIACLATLLLFFFYHPPNFDAKYRGTKSRRELVSEIDYVGLFLFVLAGVTFLVGINFGGRQYSWNSPQTLVSLIAGAVLWVVFALWECFTRSKLPLMPPRLFRNLRSFVVLLVVSFVSGMLYYSLPVLWPAESARLFLPADATVLRGAYAIIPNMGTFFAGLTLIFICSRIGHERWQIVFCLTVQTALTGSLASVGLGDKVQAVGTVFVLSCFVNQPMFMSFTILSLDLDEQSDIGVASGILSTIRLMGGAIGTAIYTTILTNTYSTRLIQNVGSVIQETGFPESEAPLLLEAASVGTPAAYKAIPNIPQNVIEQTQLASMTSYVHASSVVWLTAVAFGVLAIVCACFIKSTPASQKTAARAVVLQHELELEKKIQE